MLTHTPSQLDPSVSVLLCGGVGTSPARVRVGEVWDVHVIPPPPMARRHCAPLSWTCECQMRPPHRPSVSPLHRHTRARRCRHHNNLGWSNWVWVRACHDALPYRCSYGHDFDFGVAPDHHTCGWRASSHSISVSVLTHSLVWSLSLRAASSSTVHLPPRSCLVSYLPTALLHLLASLILALALSTGYTITPLLLSSW